MTTPPDKSGSREAFANWWKERDFPYATGSEEAIAREAYKASHAALIAAAVERMEAELGREDYSKLGLMKAIAILKGLEDGDR